MADNPQIFDIPIGNVKGPPGNTGNGISSIALLQTVGLDKTYRITMTDETHYDFTVTDGNGISGVTFNPETYTLTLTFDDGTSYTTGSLRGAPGAPGNDGISPAVTITTITGGHRVTITDRDHPQGQTFDVMDGAGNVTSVAGKTGAVALDGNDISFDQEDDYDDGTVGKALKDELNAISQKAPLIINTASGDIASFADGADGVQIRKIVGTIVPQQAAGTPSPDNPLPISGWTGAEVTSTGKNLFGGNAFADAIVSKFRNAEKNTTDKTIAYPSSGCGGIVIYDKFKPNTRYTVFTKLAESSSSSRNLIIYYTDNTITTINADVIVSTAGKSIKDIRGQYQSGTTVMLYEQCGLFEGVLTSTDFVPCSSQTLPINWQTEAGTIYGGTVTLNDDGSVDVVNTCDVEIVDGSKISKVNMAYTNIAYAQWSKPTNCALLSIYLNMATCVCNIGGVYRNTMNFDNAGNINMLAVAASGARWWYGFPVDTDVETMRSTLDGAIICYERLPQYYVNYHFDNIGELYTYFGTNNVWIDTGAITECDYPADTKLYIDGLTEPDEDMIADGLIASGKYFTVNNQLYLSTAQIAAGAQIIPGSNCTATSITEALNALNS